MKKYYITKLGNVFRAVEFKEGEEQPENMWLMLEVDLADKNHSVRSGGIISVQIMDECWEHFNKKEKFHLDSLCSGSYSHKEGFGKVFKLGWNIKDQNGKSHTLIITGGDFTNSWGYYSIIRDICRFLNELYQYDSIEDYLASKEVCDNSEWNLKDICDKVVSLAKVIELYQKYKSINPALLIVQEMEKTIENRLREIIKSDEDGQ